MAKSLGLVGSPAYAITDQVLADIERFAFDGMNKTEIAGCLGIHLTTLISKLKESANLTNAYEKGRREGLIETANQIREVKTSFFKNAQDHAAISKDGLVIQVPGDVKAQMFALERKGGWKKEIEISGNPDKPILIAPLFAKNYQKDLDNFTQVIDAAND